MNKQIYCSIVMSIVVMFIGCKDDSTDTKITTDITPYSGKWYLTLITDISSSDTVFVDNKGNFSSDSLELHSDFGNYSYTAQIMGNIDNSGNFVGNITYKNILFPFPTAIIGKPAYDSVRVSLNFNGILTGNATGKTHGNSANGVFYSPIFSGVWSISYLP